MTALTDKLKAAIEARLQVARAATQGDWKLWGMEVRADPVGDSNLDTSLAVAVTNDDERGLRTYNANHIAANSPSVVARSCEADLRVLDRHQPHDVRINKPRDDIGPGKDYPSVLDVDKWELDRMARFCNHCQDDEWPCADFQDLCARYGVSDG